MLTDPLIFLDTILWKPENELVEFKLAERWFSERKLWDYFSALSNEANLHNKESAYFILGIDQKSHLPVDTTAWSGKNALRDLKNQTHKDLGIGFREIYELRKDKKRILIFEIPACPHWNPVASNGFYYARAWESLVALDLRKLDEIRGQKNTDWSALPCVWSSVDDLDEEAIRFIRWLLSREYFDATWTTDSIEKILNRLSLMSKEWVLNNTAVLFLWKHESAIKYLHTDICKITWRYQDIKNNIEERLHGPLYPPFILAIPIIIQSINRFNVTIGDLSLFREDIRQYDEKWIEEMVVNSLAHRDWEIPMWNEIIQTPDQLEIRNPGKFRAQLDSVLLKNYVREYAYPNLCEFLTKIKLMERERRGLEKVYNAQLRKWLPIGNDFLPERTTFILSWKIKNIDFAKALLNSTDISLEQIIILDKLIIWPAELTDIESSKVHLYVEQQKRTNRYIIRRSFLQGNNMLDEHFLDWYSSLKTKEQVFLDFAKKNQGKITPRNGYIIFPNDPKSSVRVIIMNMEKNWVLEKIKRWEYRIVKKKKD